MPTLRRHPCEVASGPNHLQDGWLRRRRVSRLRLALVASALSLFVAHELYHFVDWLSWGLDYDGLRSLRDALWPFFGAQDTFGYVSHAIVNLAVLAALGWAFVRAVRIHGLRTSHSSTRHRPLS